jgi:hypothetical protein
MPKSEVDTQGESYYIERKKESIDSLVKFTKAFEKTLVPDLTATEKFYKSNKSKSRY